MEHSLDNRMESFFLAETIKYLYLLFDPTNPLLNTLEKSQMKTFKNGRNCGLGGGKKTMFNCLLHFFEEFSGTIRHIKFCQCSFFRQIFVLECIKLKCLVLNM